MHDDAFVVLRFNADQAMRLAMVRLINTQATVLVDQAIADGRLDREFRITVGIEHGGLTLKQRGFLHAAVLPQISEQYTFPDGSRFVADIWKEHFRKRFLPDRWVMKAVPRWDEKKGCMFVPKRATPHRERVSTEDLTIRQYSRFIDRVIDTAVLELGVVFEFRAGERDAVRWVAKPRKPRALPLAQRVEPALLPAPDAVAA